MSTEASDQEPSEEPAAPTVAAGTAEAEEAEPLPRGTLILIHGRGPKPSPAQLLKQWRQALDRSLERDYPKGPDLSSVRVQMVYYADLLEPISLPENYNAATHNADREAALKSLLALKNSKQFRRVHYEALPGKTSRREFFADVGAPISNILGLSEQRLKRVLPELVSYWHDDGLAKEAISRLRAHVEAAFERNEEVMVISHCLGSVVAYDTFWEMSRGPEPTAASNRVNVWVTLGSPLADDYVRHHLRGGRANVGRGEKVSYPHLINQWLNVAAEDDHVCHDETMTNDFQQMLDDKLVSRIRDYQIYNLTERFGRSNPHGSFGYLVHPRMARILNDWLTASRDT